MTQAFSRMDPFREEQARQALQEAEPTPGINPGTGAPESLAAMGAALLEIVRAAAVAKGTPLPARQSVYMAPIPADCEQVAVLFTGWEPTPAQEGPTICTPWRWIANYSVIITRCTPAIPGKGRPASTVPVEKMISAGQIASDDAEVLLETMNRLSEVGADVSIVTNAPSGGFQTVELNVPLISGGSFL